MKRTIASLALLRSNWDNYKRDYVEIFVPFIVTLVSKRKYKTIQVEEIRKDFLDEYGLMIPYYPMITILRRTKKRGYIEKKNELEYIPVKDLVNADAFSECAATLERKYNNILNKFLEFCQQYDVKLDLQNADKILIAFLKEHDLDILFANRGNETLLPEVSNTDQEKFLINKFVKDSHDSNPEIFGFIVDISFGHIIASTILYDVNIEKFQGKILANFYLDTGILFDLLGINEEPRQNASKDLLQLLSQNGSSINVFKHTYEEFLGILEGCIEWIGSPLYDPIKASRALLYFKDLGFTASEIESFILGVDAKLTQLHVSVITAPDPIDERIQPFLIDEKSLFDLIVTIYKQRNPYFDEAGKDNTLYLDVKSVSAIHSLRKGQKPLKLSDTKHIFITTNSALAYASRMFERQDVESDLDDQVRPYFFIPATMTDVFIGTLLWVQAPSKMAQINQKRLISNCYAALQPTKYIFNKFLLAAKKELDKGEITEDEFTILKVSRTARNLLAEETLNDSNMFTEKTVSVILNEIRGSIASEEAQKYRNERDEFENRQKEKDETITSLSVELDSTQLRNEKLIFNIENRAENIAEVISRMVFYFLATFLVLSVVFQLLPTVFGTELWVKIILWVISFTFSVASILTGFNIRGTRDAMKARIKQLVIDFLIQ